MHNVELTTVELLNTEVCIASRVAELKNLKLTHPSMTQVCDEMLVHYEPLLAKLNKMTERF